MCLHANSRKDPTSTAGVRRKVFAEIRKRRDAAMTEVRRYVESIPNNYTEVPDPNSVYINRRVYRFELQDRDIYRDIRDIIERWFGTAGNEPPPRWFMDAAIEQVNAQSTASEAERINRLSEMANMPSPYQIEQILSSPEFSERIRRARSRLFEEMRGFTGDTANDLARRLADGIARGDGVRTITGRITERFKVKESRAQTITRTELGHAHRQARLDQSRDARDRLGLKTMAQWISALAPTTRATHAQRHLKLYTIEEVAEFYSVDGNAINCLCSQQDVLVMDDGRIVGERKLTKRDADELARLT